MRSFDPDEDDPYVEPPDSPAITLNDDVVPIDVEEALALLDRITQDLPGGGEQREGQRQMVKAVAHAFANERHTIVEAGTGVGKSLAYLVPAALQKQRVVIATATKNLQDQLAQKDAPTVAHHVQNLKVAVLKGRGNYLCRLRTQQSGGGVQLSLDDGEIPEGVTSQVRRLIDWSNDTTTGDRDEVWFEVDDRAWRHVSVTSPECLGRTQCPQGSSCFTELAKDRAAASDLVIVNAHLYGAHLAADSTILPEHDVVIFDEAHDVADIFSQLLGTSLNAARFRAVASAARSVLSADDASLLNDVTSFADRLEQRLNEHYDNNQTTGLSDELVEVLSNGSEVMARLGERLRLIESSSSELDSRRQNALGPCVSLTNDLARLSQVSANELVWLSKRDRDVELELSLVDLGPRLRSDLWSRVTGVLTSATIPDSLASDLGLSDDCDVYRVASPFPYAQNSLLYVPEHLPSRNDDEAEAAITRELIDLIGAAGGRTLALFTNRAVMKRVAAAVRDQVDTPVLVQDTLSRHRLIEKFREDEESSLFAVTSYWQGIDVPGRSLSLVTIDRLPFRPPDDPLNVARRSRAGDRAFNTVDLPRATMLLAQGVGRLIRSSTDKGVVAVLDTRLATANYRSRMLNRLPPMKRTRNKDEVLRFLRALDD